MTTVANTIRYGIKKWWWFLVIGLLSLVAGIAIISKPVEGYISLSILFSLVMAGTGISQIVFAISVHKFMKGWGWTLTSGIIDFAIGTFLLIYPSVTMASLPFFVGFYLVFRAFYIIGASLDLNLLGASGWGWLLAGGILVLALGFLTLYHPVAGAYGIVAFSGSAFIVSGILSMIMGFQLKTIKTEVKNLETDARSILTNTRKQHYSTQ